VGIAVRRAGDVGKLASRYGQAKVPPLVVHTPAGDGESAAGFAKGVEDSLGPIEALVCANGAFSAGPLVEQAGPVLTRLLEANLVASYTMARAMAPVMARRRRGRMVFVGARSVLRPVGNQVIYNAAKGGLHALVQALAEELGPLGIAANLLAPSTLDTAANRKAMPTVDPTTWLSLDQAVDSLLFLASPLGSGLRGSVLLAAGSGG
jgi:NAD(P)-dependent dehydrogenase (short-subunit alcohol dehydrogenase family)